MAKDFSLTVLLLRIAATVLLVFIHDPPDSCTVSSEE